MKTLLIRLLLRRRKEYSDIVRIRKKNYRVVIEEFIPATEWVPQMAKALRSAEPKPIWEALLTGEQLRE